MEPVPETHLRATLALKDRGIDTSRGLEALRLYPEYKNEVLETLFDMFPDLTEDEKRDIATEIVNQQPEKIHLQRLIELFDMIPADFAGAHLRCVLAQPIGKNLDAKEYEVYRHLLQDFLPGNYRLFIAPKLSKVKD